MATRARTAVVTAPAAPPASIPASAGQDVPAALGFEKWMGFLSNVIAPATLITGLLFYFGYVSSRAFFLYFGVDVDVLGLSNQQFVMRSPGALFIPVMVLLVIAAALIVWHRVLRRRLTAAPEERRRVVTALAWIGTGLMVVGLVLAFSYALLATWPFYGFATATALAVGAGLAGYAASTARALGGGRQSRTLVVLLVAIMVAGVFWSAATVAEWWGRGQARALASDFSSLPAVVLDTKERLAPGNAAITATALDQDVDGDGVAVPGQFRYRYHGLRLLVRGGSSLFLVPDQWSADASTLVVPMSDDIRLRFRFFPDADPPT